MASLEKCTDALLQQKAVQSSNHEFLERQILDSERARRAAFVGLRGLVASVQRRSRDLGDVTEANLRCDEQLAQDKLKLRALAMGVAENTKCHGRVEGCLAAVGDAWMGQPTRIVQVVRALQERKAVVREAAALLATLGVAHRVLAVIARAGGLREWCGGRLTLQRAHLSIHRDGLALRLGMARSVTEGHRAAIADIDVQQASIRGDIAAAAQSVALLEARGAAAATEALALAEKAAAARDAVGLAAEFVGTLGQRLEQRGEQQRCAGERLAAARDRTGELDALRCRHATAHEAHRSDSASDTAAAVAAHAVSVAAAAAHREAAAALRAEALSRLHGAAACVRVLALRRALSAERHVKSAARDAAASALAAALERLRGRHAAQLSRQCAARARERLHEAVAGLAAEESLTRRLEIVAREADGFELLADRARMGAADSRARDKAAAAAAAVAAAAKEEQGAGARRRVSGVKRARRTTGSLPDGGSLADELGLGAALAPAAAAAAAAGHCTHPVGAGLRGAARPSPTRVASMFPAVRKGAAAEPTRHRDDRRRRPEQQQQQPRPTATTPSPSPRKPAMLASRAHPSLMPRPLLTQACSGAGSAASGGRALTTALQALHQKRPAPAVAATAGDRRPLHWHQSQGHATAGAAGQPAALGAAAAAMGCHHSQSDRPAPRPVAVGRRAELLCDMGEDLFEDIFS